MTGLELFKQKMIEHGAIKQMVESKTVLIALQALTDMDDYEILCDIESDIRKAKAKLESIEREIRQAEIRQRDIADRNAAIEQRTSKQLEEAKNYIDAFCKSLEDMETAEARDRLRTAQLFINSVNVDTKYDNTAFIVGLAGLLSGVTINAPEELKKINKKLPEVSQWYVPRSNSLGSY